MNKNTTKTDPRAMLATGLAKIGLVLRHHAWEEGGRRGLTPTQSQILALLVSRSPAGLTVSAIAGELAITTATASDAISALERKKLVGKSTSGEDARVVVVQLTALGRSAGTASSSWPDYLMRALDQLDEREREVFLRVLMKMVHSLQEQGRVPVARMCTSCEYFRPHAHRGREKPHHCAYVDAPLGGGDLRVDCPEHAMAEESVRPVLWQLFIEGRALGETVSRGATPRSPA